MPYQKINGSFHSNFDGSPIFYRAWIKKPFLAQKTIVLEHGYGEHSGRYQNFADGMAKSGYSIFAMDLRGHGQSYGFPGQVKDIQSYLDDLNSFFWHLEKTFKITRPVLLGHSFGAFLVLWYALNPENEKKIRLLIANGSPMSFNMSLKMKARRALSSIIAPFFKSLRVHIGLNPDFISHDLTEVENYRNDPYVHDLITVKAANQVMSTVRWCLENAPKMKVPLLLTHGGLDKISDKSGTIDFFSQCGSPDKSQIIYEGLFHEVYNEAGREKVFKDLIHWLKQRDQG